MNNMGAGLSVREGKGEFFYDAEKEREIESLLKITQLQ
jgi:hypothetical protein